MDINAIPGEVSRNVHQRLMQGHDFDAFVLQILWSRLLLPTKELLECTKAWYFGEVELEQGWRVPALVILFENAALLAKERYWVNLIDIAKHCQAVCRCDRVHVIGRDTGLRVWFDYHSGAWIRTTMPLPADWHREGY